MNVIARRTLREYWAQRPDAEQPLKVWYKHARQATWKSPADVRAQYSSASIVGSDRIVFNIRGNRYRLIVRIDYECQLVFIRFIGTHVEYDKIDAKTV